MATPANNQPAASVASSPRGIQQVTHSQSRQGLADVPAKIESQSSVSSSSTNPFLEFFNALFDYVSQFISWLGCCCRSNSTKPPHSDASETSGQTSDKTAEMHALTASSAPPAEAPSDLKEVGKKEAPKPMDFLAIQTEAERDAQAWIKERQAEFAKPDESGKATLNHWFYLPSVWPPGRSPSAFYPVSLEKSPEYIFFFTLSIADALVADPLDAFHSLKEIKRETMLKIIGTVLLPGYDDLHEKFFQYVLKDSFVSDSSSAIKKGWSLQELLLVKILRSLEKNQRTECCVRFRHSGTLSVNHDINGAVLIPSAEILSMIRDDSRPAISAAELSTLLTDLPFARLDPTAKPQCLSELGKRIADGLCYDLLAFSQDEARKETPPNKERFAVLEQKALNFLSAWCSFCTEYYESQAKTSLPHAIYIKMCIDESGSLQKSLETSINRSFYLGFGSTFLTMKGDYPNLYEALCDFGPHR